MRWSGINQVFSHTNVACGSVKTAEVENVLFQLLSSGDLWRTGG